jgi:hypothetical protein
MNKSLTDFNICKFLQERFQEHASFFCVWRKNIAKIRTEIKILLQDWGVRYFQKVISNIKASQHTSKLLLGLRQRDKYTKITAVCFFNLHESQKYHQIQYTS